MVLFIETVNFNPDFAKKVYDLFYNPDKKKCDLYWRTPFKSILGWPDGLDTENLEIVSIGMDHITYWAGGDWQEGATVNLQLNLKGKLVWIPFEAYTKKPAIVINNAIADLEEQGQALMESIRQEDCQIAGPMMGDLPVNVGSTLSLGYKNSRILPPLKKRSDAKDYRSIPHF